MTKKNHRVYNFDIERPPRPAPTLQQHRPGFVRDQPEQTLCPVCIRPMFPHFGCNELGAHYVSGVDCDRCGRVRIDLHPQVLLTLQKARAAKNLAIDASLSGLGGSGVCQTSSVEQLKDTITGSVSAVRSPRRGTDLMSRSAEFVEHDPGTSSSRLLDASSLRQKMSVSFANVSALRERPSVSRASINLSMVTGAELLTTSRVSIAPDIWTSQPPPVPLDQDEESKNVHPVGDYKIGGRLAKLGRRVWGTVVSEEREHKSPRFLPTML